MNLGCARGMPVRLTSTVVITWTCGSSMVKVVDVVVMSFFADVSSNESNALK